MSPQWDVFADDDGVCFGETATFLQQFAPPPAAPLWSEDYFRWKLGDANPAGRGFCSVARHEGRIVGAASITRKRLWLGDGIRIGGEIGDTYTDTEFRRKGSAVISRSGPNAEYLNRSIFGRLVTETRERAEAAGLTLIYGTPNANSLPGYHNRLGFPEYDSQVCENYLRPTFSGISERFPFFRRVKSLLVPLDSLIPLLGIGIYRIYGRGHSVAPFSGDDDEVDNLWSKVKRDFAFSVVRDSLWFRHRYIDHPLNHYDLYAVRRKGELRAIVVTRRFTTMRGRPYLYVADWLFGRGDSAIFGRALNAACTQTKGEPIDGILLWAERQSAAARVARTSGFLTRGKSPLIFADTADAKDLKAQVPRFDFPIGFSDNV